MPIRPLPPAVPVPNVETEQVHHSPAGENIDNPQPRTTVPAVATHASPTAERFNRLFNPERKTTAPLPTEQQKPSAPASPVTEMWPRRTVSAPPTSSKPPGGTLRSRRTTASRTAASGKPEGTTSALDSGNAHLHDADNLIYTEYARAAARLLIAPDANNGEVDASRIDDMLATLRNDTTWGEHDMQRAHIERSLLALRNNIDLRTTINSTCTEPSTTPKGPARGTIRATLNLPVSENVESIHARQAMVMALLGRLPTEQHRHSSYAAAVAQLMHQHMPLQAAQGWKSLLENNHLPVRKGNTRIQVPLHLNLSKTSMQAEHIVSNDGHLPDGTALHQVHGMQAALHVLGIPQEAMAKTVGDALVRIRANEESSPISFQMLIEDIAQHLAPGREGEKLERAAAEAFACKDEVGLLRVWEETLASAAYNSIASHHLDKLRKVVIYGEPQA